MSSRRARLFRIPASRSRRHRRFAPGLVALEARALLSTLYVTNDTDNPAAGSGSLRGELAAAGPGDTIKFKPSAYGTITLTNGPLSVATNVDIQGPGASKVTVSGDQQSTVFDIPGGVTATISGLTVTDGLASVGAGGVYNAGTLTLSGVVVAGNSAPAGGYSPGGIMNLSGTLTVSDSVVTGNSAPAGSFAPGGILNVFGTTTLSDDVITDNAAAAGDEAAGGVENFQGTLTIAGTTIAGNSGNQGGGINNDGPLSITGSTIADNICPACFQGGGGIDSFASMSLTDSVVSGNVGGGVALFGGGYGTTLATLTITNSRVVNNTNTYAETGTNQAFGGGVSDFGADVTITGSTISGNVVEGATAQGAGIYLAPNYGASTPATLTVVDTTFRGNQVVATGAADSGGGAIHADYDTDVSVTGCSFQGNTVTAASGGSGGAIDLLDTVTDSITDSRFAGNQVVATGLPGAGPALVTGGAISNQGGALPVGSTTALTITGSTFANNLARSAPGGGLAQGGAILNQGNNTTLDVSSSLFTGNDAVGGAAATSGTGNAGGFAAGGALANNLGATAMMSDSTFLGNTAVGGAATGAGNQGGAALGGAIQSLSPSLTVTGCSLIGNAAIGGDGTAGAAGGDGQGGAIQVLYGGLQLSHSSLFGNLALGGSGGGAGEGGGVFVSGTGANASITDVLISLNSAIGGAGGGKGYGGGLYIGTGALTTLTNTKVVLNDASTAGDNTYQA